MHTSHVLVRHEINKRVDTLVPLCQRLPCLDSPKRSCILAHVYFFHSSIILKVTMNILFTMIYLNKIFVEKRQIIIFSGLIKLVSKEVKEEKVRQGRRSSGSVEKGASFPRVRQTVVFPIHDELAKLNAR